MTSESVRSGELDRVAVSADVIDADAAARFVSDPRAGAIVVFLGTVRNHSPGRDVVTHLEYEAYVEHVEERIGEIVGEARSKWPLERVFATHRVGRLEIGEASVAVAVSSAHRDDAFPAARYLIDELKARAPIWKKEHWSGGADWVEEGTRQPAPDE